jgi:two-component system sensor histidine kinase CpxA
VARPVEGAHEAHYAFVAELPRRQPPPLVHHVAHILGLLLIGGAFCYWLARYLTAPVKKLRIATQELAQGNLSARVGLAGNRRDELVSLGSDFDLMAEKIESLVQAQRRLLGDISHELRSPLARLNVALELARQRSGNEAVTALARIQREAETLNEMIGQLLTLTRLQTGAQEIQKSEFDLCGLVREIADDAEFEAKSGNRSVRLESNASCTFVGNAVHYTREGTEVEINVNEVIQEGTAIEITVRDHGPGVPEPALGKIFRPFYRVDEARDREAGGVGLGLAIAERAVKLHNGSINARNAAEGGLAITITLDGSP